MSSGLRSVPSPKYHSKTILDAANSDKLSAAASFQENQREAFVHPPLIRQDFIFPGSASQRSWSEAPTMPNSKAMRDLYFSKISLSWLSYDLNCSSRLYSN